MAPTATPAPSLSPSGSPPPAPGHGWIGPLLHDPSGWVTRTFHVLAAVAGPWLPAIAVLVVVVGVVWPVESRLLDRRRCRHAAEGARVVEVRLPPKVEPASAEVFWGNLVGLLRPAWRRWWDGQPYLVWTYTFTARGLSVSIWVPGQVPPGLVERAVEAAWPAARTRVLDPAPPIPPRSVATGGVLRLHGPEVLPIRAGHAADPLRALLGAAAGMAGRETAVVQVLARPVTGRRRHAGHQAAARLRAGQTIGRRTGRISGRLLQFASLVVEIVVDVVRLRTTRPVPPPDPEQAGLVRAVLDKAIGPQWEVQIRYAAAVAASASTSRGGRVTSRPEAARGRAHGLASVYALYAGRNGFARHRLHHPARSGCRWPPPATTCTSSALPVRASPPCWPTWSAPTRKRGVGRWCLTPAAT